MQRLVAIGLRDRDVILEFARQRLVQAMDDSQHPVALIRRVHDHPEPVDIEDLVERQVLVPHLAINAVDAFLAPLDLRLDAALLDMLNQVLANFLDPIMLAPTVRLDGFLEDAATHWIERFEGTFLQFQTECIHPQTTRDRHIDLEGFTSDSLPLFSRQYIQRTHVVQAIGQLDQHHPDVAHRRQHHLAEIGRLRLAARDPVQVRQLADPVNQVGHILAEFFPNLIAGSRCVLDYIVQQGRNDRVRVQMQAGQCTGNRQGMSNVGLTGQPVLLGVPLGTEYVRPVDPPDLF